MPHSATISHVLLWPVDTVVALEGFPVALDILARFSHR